MKRLANVSAIPTIICFIALMLWGERVREFSAVLYFLMFAVLAVGYASILIQSERDSKRAIANKAVAQYKKDHGITD